MGATFTYWQLSQIQCSGKIITVCELRRAVNSLTNTRPGC